MSWLLLKAFFQVIEKGTHIELIIGNQAIFNSEFYLKVFAQLRFKLADSICEAG